jgi:diguanylate cyclase (GGDEF)-like protein
MLLFFVIIVVIPMIAVALVLARITEGSQVGRADSELAQALQVAIGMYDDARRGAVDDLDRVQSDPGLRRAFASGDSELLEQRATELVERSQSIDSIGLYDRGGGRVASAGDPAAIAYATATPTEQGGAPLGRIAVSTTTAPEFAGDVDRLTGLPVRVVRRGRLIGETLQATDGAQPGATSLISNGEPFRGRYVRLPEQVGPPLQVGLFQPAGMIESSIADDRTVVTATLIGFFLLALGSVVFIVRSLGGQVDRFLSAARSVGRGEFDARVPVEGSDEFAALGREFNAMSERLQANADELDRRSAEREEAIRRIGEAFAGGLDRGGMTSLAARTATEACSADAGRALAGEATDAEPVWVGDDDARLRGALESAERAAADSPERPVEAERDGVHALAAALRGRSAHGYRRTLGFLSIARREQPFDSAERDLFAYLAAQTSVSLDNASLHETVQAQARTDALTGLYNRRHLEAVLESEIGRSHRFGSEVGLVMVDLDGFKPINDTYGHQDGDRVLIEIATLLKRMTREVDQLARYGGDEIAIVLPESDVEGAVNLAERIRVAIEALEVERTAGGAPLRLTASFGVASLPESGTDRDSLVAVADAALYRAKRGGGNRVERGDTATVPR